MECWEEIHKLKGRTLKTLDRGNPFDVVDVTERVVVVRPHENNKVRKIGRDRIEGAYKELIAKREITRSEIRSKYSEFNPAYIAAMLANLPGVTHITKPIRLKYGQ
jgi:hypothetical protein